MQVHVHSKAEEKDLLRELQLASTADHPNIVRHLCAYYCEDAHGDHYVWIAMELMAHGALNGILDRGWRLWVRVIAPSSRAIILIIDSGMVILPGHFWFQ